MVDTDVLVAIITTAGAILTTVGVKILANRRTLAKQPKDRIELAFEYYDGFIKQQKVVIDDQAAIIKNLRQDLDEAQLSLEKTQEIINRQQEYITEILNRVEQSQQTISDLHTQLEALKKDYKGTVELESQS